MKHFSLVVPLVAGLLLASCRGAEVASTPVPEPASTPATTAAINASDLYVANCVPCHGVSRHGVYGSGGALMPESLAGRSDVAIKETISQGIPFTAMPSFRHILSPEEIDALLQFIKYTPP
jgi:mono/diheme cytochrome c family protein